MVFASDVWLPAWSTLRRWLRDGPEGQQLKHDVMSSFQDGSLDVTNPDFMALISAESRRQCIQNIVNKSFRNHARLPMADLVSLLSSYAVY